MLSLTSRTVHAIVGEVRGAEYEGFKEDDCTKNPNSHWPLVTLRFFQQHNIYKFRIITDNMRPNRTDIYANGVSRKRQLFYATMCNSFSCSRKRSKKRSPTAEYIALQL